ncbi:MAG: TRAP transporter small permease subunit [Myxococcota bacterium]
MTDDASAPRGPVSWFYEVALARVEQWLVFALLMAVISLSSVEIVVRALQLDLFDRVTAQVASYFLAFHLGLFGGVLACRDARHIAIDALAPHLPRSFRRPLQALLLGVAALTCVWLSTVAYDYVFHQIEAGTTIVPGLTSAFWSERAWKFPLVLSFAWMALHFAVTAVSAARGTLADPLHVGGVDPQHEVELDAVRGDTAGTTAGEN